MKTTCKLTFLYANCGKRRYNKLCQHARMLNAELEAAGEKTLDLVANLLAGLEKTPDVNFQIWLANKRD